MEKKCWTQRTVFTLSWTRDAYRMIIFSIVNSNTVHNCDAHKVLSVTCKKIVHNLSHTINTHCFNSISWSMHWKNVTCPRSPLHISRCNHVTTSTRRHPLLKHEPHLYNISTYKYSCIRCCYAFALHFRSCPSQTCCNIYTSCTHSFFRNCNRCWAWSHGTRTATTVHSQLKIEWPTCDACKDAFSVLRSKQQWNGHCMPILTQKALTKFNTNWHETALGMCVWKTLVTLFTDPLVWTPPHLSIDDETYECCEMDIVCRFWSGKHWWNSTQIGMRQPWVCVFEKHLSPYSLTPWFGLPPYLSIDDSSPNCKLDPKKWVKTSAVHDFCTALFKYTSCDAHKTQKHYRYMRISKQKPIFHDADNVDLWHFWTQVRFNPESHKFHWFTLGFLHQFVHLPFRNTIATNILQKNQFWVHTTNFSWCQQCRSTTFRTRVRFNPKSRKFHWFTPGFLLHFVSQPFIHKIGTNVFQKQHLGLHTEEKKTEKHMSCWCCHFLLQTAESDKRS